MLQCHGHAFLVARKNRIMTVQNRPGLLALIVGRCFGLKKQRIASITTWRWQSCIAQIAGMVASMTMGTILVRIAWIEIL